MATRKRTTTTIKSADQVLAEKIADSVVAEMFKSREVLPLTKTALAAIVSAAIEVAIRVRNPA